MLRVDEVGIRNRELAETMTRQMERLREREREQAGLLLRLSEGVGAQVRETKQSMEGIVRMLADPAMAGDAEMIRDMERLRRHLHSVTGGLDEMVGTLEQMNKRLQARSGRGT